MRISSSLIGLIVGLIGTMSTQIVVAQAVENVLDHPKLRDGLPHFFSRLEAGDSVTIAFLGGSITAAAEGWRDQTITWLQHRFAAATIKQVNAGVGGTGSDLGVFRLKKDVLVHAPDLVYVEFAVNDNGKSQEIVRRAMEGVVRQVRAANPSADICFVYTLTADMAPVLGEGRLTNTIENMERIADHYGLPSVFMGREVIRKFRNNTLVFRGELDEYPGKMVFSKDGVHPYPATGHRLYTNELTHTMLALQPVGKPTVRELPMALDPSNWEDATLVTPDELIQQGHWEQIADSDTILPAYLKKAFPQLLRGAADDQPTASITFEGRAVGLYDIVGPGTGQLAIYIDGQLVEKRTRFDRYATYYRPQYFLLPEIPAGKHTVRFRVLHESIDKVGILGDKALAEGERQAYERADVYIGYVMLLGGLTQ